jgi:quinolinate synthase
VQFTTQALEKLRTQFPDAPTVAHPECVQAVRDLADEVCSTELMVKYARESSANRLIIVTESGMLHRLQREVPTKTFIAGPTDTCACNDCRFMKMNTIEKVRDALLKKAPAIELPETIRSAALAPIQRMLDWSKR